MKRKTTFVLIALLSMILVVTGCGKSVCTMDIADDMKSALITLEKSAKGDFMTSGSLSVEDNDTIYIEPALEGDSEVNIKLIGAIASQDGSEDIAEELSNADPVLDVNINGTGTTECTLPSGDYYISVTVVKKATGTINIKAENASTGIANPWTDVASAEEAAQGAGLDTFEIPAGTEISLGALDTISYRCMDGLAEAQIPVAAVEMTIRKGTGDEDISGDYNTYKNEWTEDINGLEVKCFGNREGEATKTIWTSGDYSYAILAYGAGGDDDYGLPADDLNTLISGIQ